jgi:hypothetical protein
MTKVSGVGHIKASNTETYIRKIECLTTNYSFNTDPMQNSTQGCPWQPLCGTATVLRCEDILNWCIPNTNFSREINMDNRYLPNQTLITKEVYFADREC